MNQITIIGNLVRDPELRTTPNGINVCSFTVAVNRRQKPQEADYFRVNAWREMGDNCSKYLSKGRKVAVVGSISLNTYKGSDGQTKASMDILASNVEFLTPKTEQTNDSPDGFVPVNPEGLPF